MATKNTDDMILTDSDEEALAQFDIEEFCSSTTTSAMAGETGVVEVDDPVKSTPAAKYRPKYLIVSDLTKQTWCEQQLLYSLDPDLYLQRAPPGETVTIEESKDAKEIKQKGSEIHLQRELEVQVPVEIAVESKEDAWAVKVLNLQAAVLGFHYGQKLAREIPVFGSPFGCDLLVFGIVDEMTYDPCSHTLKISELKTRKSPYPPKPAQLKKDTLQVALYAQLFNDLVLGRVSPSLLADRLCLDLQRPLGQEVSVHARAVSGAGSGSQSPTLGSLLETVLLQLQSLTVVETAQIEYIHQASNQPVYSAQVCLASEPTEIEMTRLSEWWKGRRATMGVEVEECWKCDYCPYRDLCEWREIMANKLSKLNEKG